MFSRLIFFIIGSIMFIVGFIYIMCYLNLLTIGYNFFDYVKFIIGRIECIMFIIGLFIILFTIYFPRRKK